MRLYILVWLTIVIGWVLNVYQVVVGLMALPLIAQISGMLVLKIVCIFVFPVGAVLGWLGLFF